MQDRRILSTWLPLAASWALMTLESPIVYAGVARLPDPERMLAAAGIVISLEVTIESPVIMLLATSTALARSHAAYRVLRRFTMHVNLLLTVVAAIVAFVPAVFEWIVPGLMGVPPAIAQHVRPGLAVMVLWTTAIGWRRFHQGILIRFGESRAVGWGTAVRLVFAAGSAVGLTFWPLLPGVLVGAVAWMAGVLSEVVVVHFAARATIRRHLPAPLPGAPAETGPSYAEVARYHAPLAATSVLSLLAMPIIGAALSRMPDPERSLAAWPVLFSLLLFFRSPGLALPETVIALLDGRERMRPLRRFCLAVGIGSSAALLLCAATPALPFLLSTAQAVEAPLVRIIVPAAILSAAIPGLQSEQSWLRGVLMTGGSTGHVYLGNCVSLVTLVTTLALGMLGGAPGVLAAVAAVTLSMAAETVYLARRARGVAASLASSDTAASPPPRGS